MTGKQRAVLVAVAGGLDPGRDVSSHCNTTVDLADAIGVDRKTISRWLKLPDNPGRQPDDRLIGEAWFAYKATRPAGRGDYAEKHRRIDLQNQKLEWEIAELKKSFTQTSDVQRWGGELGAAIRKIVTGSLTKAEPSLVGCSVPDAESRLKRLEEELLEQLHTIGTA